MTGYEASVAIHEGGLCSVIPGVAWLVTVVILSAWVANRFLFYFGFSRCGNSRSLYSFIHHSNSDLSGVLHIKGYLLLFMV